MKKLSILFPLFLISLSACSPQDPAVLTPQEKAAKNRSKGGSGGDANVSAATLSSQPDATGASYLLDRHTEIANLLLLGLDLSQGADLQDRFGSCASILKVQRSSSLLEIRLDLDSCSLELKKHSLRQSGAYTFQIALDETQKIRSLKIFSAPIDQRGFAVLNSELRKANRPRDSVQIKESISIELFKQDLNQDIWTVVSAESVAEAKILAKDKETQVLITKTKGSLEVLAAEAGGSRQVRHSLSSVLRHEGKKDYQDKTEFYDLMLKTVDVGLNNRESVSSCNERTGKYKIKFKYRFNRDNDDLVYDRGLLRISANPKVGASEVSAVSCAEAVQGRKGGLFLIDWSLLFL